MTHVIVRKKALDIADRHSLVQLPPPTRGFARVVAHTATYPGQGIVFLDDTQGFFKPTFGSQRHVSLHVDPERAFQAAGTHLSLVQLQGTGRTIGRRSGKGQATLLLQGTDLDAAAATSTQI